MGALISDVDLAELRSLYPLARFDAGFTGQQEQFMLYTMKGLAPRAAATAAGYTHPDTGYSLLKDERVQKALALLREKIHQEIRITRDQLNSMLLDSHSRAATVTEEIMAVRELGKMNGLYESDKQRSPGVVVNVGGNHVHHTHKQLERMDEQELLEMAGETIVLSAEHFKRVEGPDGD